MLRTFIALEIDDEIKQEIGRIEDHLKSSGADIRWVKPVNLHLTLKFLGETPTEKLVHINALLEKVCEINTNFLMELSSVGGFPNTKNPKVIWLGFSKGKEEILKIEQQIEELLSEQGFAKEEREFSPHLTIGRKRSSLNQFALATMLQNYTLPNTLRQQVKTLSFIKSTLTPEGPIYEPLSTWSFK